MPIVVLLFFLRFVSCFGMQCVRRISLYIIYVLGEDHDGSNFRSAGFKHFSLVLIYFFFYSWKRCDTFFFFNTSVLVRPCRLCYNYVFVLHVVAVQKFLSDFCSKNKSKSELVRSDSW